MKQLFLLLLFLSLQAHAQLCSVYFEKLSDDNKRLTRFIERDFAADEVVQRSFAALSSVEARHFLEAIGSYDYRAFQAAVDVLKKSPEMFQRFGRFSPKMFLLEMVRPGSALKRFEQNQSWVFKGKKYDWQVPEFESGSAVSDVDKSFRAAFVATRDFLDNPKAVHAHMQDLEDEIMVLCLKTDPDYFTKTADEQFLIREKAMEKTLGDLEQKHGFKSSSATEYQPLTLEDKSYDLNQWFEMLRGGQAFNDSAFLRGKDAPSLAEYLSKEVNRSGHGYYTHRIQWYILMKDMDQNPVKYYNIPASELMKKLGDMDFNQKLKLGDNASNTLWQHLFDSFSGSYHQPEFFRKMHADYPDLGPWL